MKPGEMKAIRYIFTDVDGTITTDGRLELEAYTALHKLKDSGFSVIPVSGGGAGTAVTKMLFKPKYRQFTERLERLE